MKILQTLFVSCAGVACCAAQSHAPACCTYLTTPAEADRWENPFPVPASTPSGETVSVARLRHRPPAKARDAFFRGIARDEAGAYEEAAAQFEQAIARDADFSEAHGNLGVEYTALGRLDEAIAEFQRASALDPATSVHHSNFAYALIRLNRNHEAEDEAQAATSLDSTNATARFLLGVLWAQRPEKRDAAETQLIYAARTVPAAHLALAQMYAAEGSAQSARTQLDRYIEETTAEKRVPLNGRPGVAVSRGP